LADIGEVKHLARQAFESNRESTVRRHPQVEHGEVAFEGRRVNGPGPERRFQILAAMKPLSAGSDFKALE